MKKNSDWNCRRHRGARRAGDGIEVYDALTLTVPGSGMLMIVR